MGLEISDFFFCWLKLKEEDHTLDIYCRSEYLMYTKYSHWDLCGFLFLLTIPLNVAAFFKFQLTLSFELQTYVLYLIT